MVTRVLDREVEAERLVVVEYWGVDGAVDEGEDGVGRGWDEGGLEVRHEEVVVGLKDGACGHGGVVDGECFGGVVDGLHLVAARWGLEEESIGGRSGRGRGRGNDGSEDGCGGVSGSGRCRGGKRYSKGGGAIEHVAVLWGTATIVDAEGIVYSDTRA